MSLGKQFFGGFFFSIFSFIWANEGTQWHGQMKMRKEALKTYEQKYYAFLGGERGKGGEGGTHSIYTYWSFLFNSQGKGPPNNQP
jgi:hypothetical protein